MKHESGSFLTSSRFIILACTLVSSGWSHISLVSTSVKLRFSRCYFSEQHLCLPITSSISYPRIDTTVCSVAVFKRPPLKRLCFDAPPRTPIDSFDRDVKLVYSVLRRNNKLFDEISVLRAENAELKKALESCAAVPLKQPSQPPRSLPSPHPPSIVHSDEAYDKKALCCSN
ncbi:hypothetical protein Q1695_006070 [Nippostrongylus brasiliensis]|nr:hypothetical protein Q1695_006070 [Nippostrongylus brasiliensis]